MSLNIFNKNLEQVYISNNNSFHQVNIFQLKNNKYTAMKPSKNKYTKLNKLLKSFFQTELKEYVSNLINYFLLFALITFTSY